MVFLSQKVDGNIFTDYWKVLVLTFSEMGSTVFSWAKKLTKIWYLLVTGKFLFWTFWWLEIRFFLCQEVDAKIICTGYWEVLVLNFSVTGNTVFFSAKMLMERWSFWAFYDIPGPRIYGFLCSESSATSDDRPHRIDFIYEILWNCFKAKENYSTFWSCL